MSTKKQNHVVQQQAPATPSLSSIAGAARTELQSMLSGMHNARDRLEHHREGTAALLTVLEGQIELYDRLIQAAQARAKELF
jgi:hypothetical protein